MALVIEKFKKGRSIQTKKQTSKKEDSKKAVPKEESSNEETIVEAVEAPQVEQVPQTQPIDDYTIHYNDKEYDPIWVRDYIEKNVNTFINNENMTLGQAEKFRETIKDIILPSIDAKVLDFSDPYTLNVPTNNSSDGYYNTAGSGIFRYDITDDNKAGMIAATRYLRSLLSSPDAISRKPKEAYNGDKVLIKALAEKLGNGNAAAFKSVWEAYTPKERRQALQEVLGSLDYNNIFKLYNFDDASTKDAVALLTAVANLQAALKNDKAKDDKLASSTYAAAGKVGISLLKSLLYGEEKKQAPAAPTGAEGGAGVSTGTGTGTDTGIDTGTGTGQGISLADIEAATKVTNILNNFAIADENNIISIPADKKYLLGTNQTNAGAELQKEIDALNKTPYKSNSGTEYNWIEYTNKFIFKNLINGTLKSKNKQNSEDWKPFDKRAAKAYYYYILLEAKKNNPDATKAVAYYDPDTNKVVVADFVNNRFVVGGITPYDMLLTNDGKNLLEKTLKNNNLDYDKYSLIMNSTPSNKKGGTLRRKYLEGGKAAEYSQQVKANIKANNDAQKPKGMDQKTWDAKTSLMSDTDGINFTGSDYARMAALALDIIAFGASFGVGYGSLAAGALGITSALTDLGADIFDDSVTTGEVLTNLGLNLGLGIAGALPGGKAGSLGAKLVKWGSKLAKWVAIGGGISAGLEVFRIIGKGQQVGWNNLSRDDWTSLIRAVLLATGGTASARVAKNRANASEYFHPKRTTKTTNVESVTIRGKFKQPTNNTGGVFRNDKELKFDLTNPEHRAHWEALKTKNSNGERVRYLKEKGLIADADGQKIRGALPGSKSFYNDTGMYRTRSGRLYNWDEFKANNPDWKTIIAGGKEGRGLFTDREFRGGLWNPQNWRPGSAGLHQERDMIRGYLENLRVSNPDEYLKAIREINDTVRTKRWKQFKKLDEMVADIAKWRLRRAPRYYGYPNGYSEPTTPTGRPIALIGAGEPIPLLPQYALSYRAPIIYVSPGGEAARALKQGGILSSNIQFAKQILSHKRGGKSSKSKSSKTKIIDYSIVLNSPEYKKAWEKVLDELDANPNSNILELLNDLLNSWLTNSNTLFGSEGYTGTIKKGNGAVTSRRQIFNNTELGKAINIIINANDGLDDYFGPLENTRHFGKKEHLSLISKIVDDLIAEGQKNNKYKNLKSLKIVDNNGILRFQLNASNGDASGTGKDLNGENLTASGKSVDVGTPLSTKNNKKININLPLLYADIRYNNTLNSLKKINSLYHTYTVGFNDPTRQSFVYNDNYSPLKNAEQQAASNLGVIQTSNSSDPSVNNAALLEGIRTNNKAMAEAQAQADANIRENNKLNQAIADANAKEAVETANENREKLNKFNNAMIDIDISNELALYNSRDRYLAEQQQIATQKLMLANAMDYSRYTEALNAQVFHEQSELAKLARKELADLAERLKKEGKTEEQIYNDPEFIALSNSFLKQMHEIVSRHRINSADYLGSLISFNPYTWVRPDNMTFDVSYTPSFKSSTPTNKRVTVGKRGLKLRKGGETKYSYDKAKEAYLKFLRDDYKLVSKRNAKVLHGQYK